MSQDPPWRLGRLTLIALLTLIAPRLAQAAPLITVRGHAEIRILGLQQGQGQPLLEGQLVDRELQAGIAGRRILIEARAGNLLVRQRVTTDAAGHFLLPLHQTRSPYQVQASFAGDQSFAATQHEAPQVDLRKGSVLLQLELGSGELDAASPRHTIEVEALAAGQRVSLPLTLHLDGQDPPLARIQTHQDGPATLQLASGELGPPGPRTIGVRFAGDARYNAARRSYEILLLSPVQVSLEAETQTVAADGEILLGGLVGDLQGPLADGTVAIEVAGQHVASANTDAAGRFAARLPAADFIPGLVNFAAVYTPKVIWRRPGRSPLLGINVLAPQPVPLVRYLVSAAGTLLVIAGLFAWRQRQALLACLRPALPPAPTPPKLPPQHQTSGLRLGKRGLRSLRAHSLELSGTVWDPTDTRPLAGARVSVSLQAGGSASTRTGADGRFLISELPPGSHLVTVSQLGYVSERFPAVFPHHGGLQGIRVDLVQVRVRLLEIYREVTLHLLPQGNLWATWTPQELLHHLARQRGRRIPPLEGITQLLEQTYWSAALASEDTLPQARALADQLGALSGAHRSS